MTRRSSRRMRSARKGRIALRLIAALLLLLLVSVVALFPREEAPSLAAPATPAQPPEPTADDREAALFTLCDGPVRVNCVVDGDTIWYGGEKIRIADINAPEVSYPACAREAELGEQASWRMQELLNEGPFTLAPHPGSGDRDRYGRLLRTITREDESLGAMLVEEGLAEEWRGWRGGWC